MSFLYVRVLKEEAKYPVKNLWCANDIKKNESETTLLHILLAMSILHGGDGMFHVQVLLQNIASRNVNVINVTVTKRSCTQRRSHKT
jgi:hypothetical protein